MLHLSRFTSLSNAKLQPLTDDQVRKLAPSAFAANPHESRGARYAYIPTIDVISSMRAAGFDVTSAAQSRTRDESRAEHTKHLIRFRPQGSTPTAEGLYPEIALLNSHDGTSSYQLFAGVFRLICANGLMVGETVDAVRIRHTGNPIREVIDASYSVIDNAKRALTVAADMNQLKLNRDEQHAFAEAAHLLRFEGSPLAEAIRPDQLLRPHRSADTGSSLFDTLNVVQENTIRGGLRGVAISTDERGRRTSRRVTTREVKGIDQQTSLNRALWTLAERMQQLKAA
jgi:hypothetical protein